MGDFCLIAEVDLSRGCETHNHEEKAMKRIVIPLLALTLFGMSVVTAAEAAKKAPKVLEYAFIVTDTENGRSNVVGTIRLQSVAKNKTLVRVQAVGLSANGSYMLTWSPSDNCAVDAVNDAARTFLHFTVRGSGRIDVSERVNVAIGQIGSIGLHADTPGGVLVACAKTR